MKKYDRLVAWLFAACEIPSEYPNAPVLIDTEKMSDVCEKLFIEEGLLEVTENAT